MTVVHPMFYPIPSLLPVVSVRPRCSTPNTGRSMPWHPQQLLLAWLNKAGTQQHPGPNEWHESA
jgi:hypothetical protein